MSQIDRILAVDDNSTNLAVLEEVLGDTYSLRTAENGENAIAVAAEFLPELVLLDVMMPGIDGYETCRRLRENSDLAHTKIFMISARTDPGDRVKGYEVGADDYLCKPIVEDELLAKIQVASRMRNHLLVESVDQELDSTGSVVTFALAKLADTRDPESSRHLFRLRAYSQLLAERLAETGPYADRIDQQFLRDLFRASPLHDIGKVGIPEGVLLATEGMSDEEFQIYQQHTTIGAEILEQASVRSPEQTFLKMAAVIALCHHERFDGLGYPLRLRGDDIPLPARIVSVADVYDTLTSERNGKGAYEPVAAKTIVEGHCGKRFDPVVIDAFRSQFESFVAVPDQATDELSEIDVAGSLAV